MAESHLLRCPGSEHSLLAKQTICGHRRRSAALEAYLASRGEGRQFGEAGIIFVIGFAFANGETADCVRLDWTCHMHPVYSIR